MLFRSGEIFKIEEVNPYPSDYNECIKVAKSDIEKGLKPAIKGSIDDIDKYDIIFIGTPNWWSTMAPPVLTFLSSYNLSGKTIIPFCTHGGGGKARCFSDMEPLQPKATFKKGLAISGHKPQADIDKAIRNSKTVDTWLKDCNVIK